MRKHFSLSALPDTIAVFPLEGALLLPHARLPLNIFEPRYLAMIDDALRSDHRLIGMIQPKAEGDPAPVYAIGCAGRLTSFSETDDGRYLIALSGVSRFRIADEVEGFTPFRRFTVHWTDFEEDLRVDSFDVDEPERETFLELAQQYFEAASLSADWDALSRADHETLMNAIAMLCPFSPQEKQALLEAPTLLDRERDLRALMRFVVAAPGGGEHLQ